MTVRELIGRLLEQNLELEVKMFPTSEIGTLPIHSLGEKDSEVWLTGLPDEILRGFLKSGRLIP